MMMCTFDEWAKMQAVHAHMVAEHVNSLPAAAAARCAASVWAIEGSPFAKPLILRHHDTQTVQESSRIHGNRNCP